MLGAWSEKLNNLSVAKKVSLLLSLIFISGIIFSGLTLSRLLEHQAETTTASRALLLMTTMDAVREYTNTQVKPELEKRQDTTFVPEIVPAYSAREVFGQIRQSEEYIGYNYKEATLNPTNLLDKADAFETKIVEAFRKTPQIAAEQFGTRSTKSGDFFYVARPIRIQKQSCLECHSQPALAPKGMLAIYGTKNGFGWQLNEIIGAQMVTVPLNAVKDNARRSFTIIMSLFSGIFTIAILAANYWIKRHILKPIKTIARAAEEVSTGNFRAEFVQDSKDEIGMLSDSFNRMKTSIILAMRRLEKYRGQQSL